MENIPNMGQLLVTRLVKGTEDKENNQGVSKEAFFYVKSRINKEKLFVYGDSKNITGI